MPTKPKLAKSAIVEAIGPGEDTPFVHETPYGTITLPSLATGPMPKPYALARARANKDMLTMTALMVRAKAGDNASRVEDILEQLDEEQFSAFFEAWNAHSGVDAGE